MVLHYTLIPGGSAVQTIPDEYNAFAYVFSGTGRFGREQRQANEREMVLFERDGDAVAFAAPSEAQEPLEFLLIGGVPLGESVARYGPFVMNTNDEIAQAISDYQSGQFGKIVAVR